VGSSSDAGLGPRPNVHVQPRDAMVCFRVLAGIDQHLSDVMATPRLVQQVMKVRRVGAHARFDRRSGKSGN